MSKYENCSNRIARSLYEGERMVLSYSNISKSPKYRNTLPNFEE